MAKQAGIAGRGGGGGWRKDPNSRPAAAATMSGGDARCVCVVASESPCLSVRVSECRRGCCVLVCGVWRRASASLTKPITIPLQLASAVRSLFAWALSRVCVCVKKQSIGLMDLSVSVCV